MGGKRTGTRKYLLLCVAVLILLPLTGCAPLKAKKAPRAEDPSQRHLTRGRELLAIGDYEGALRENEKVISMESNAPPADRALFTIGLIYALPGNPKKDHGKSLDSFRKLIQKYPQSAWIEEAKAMAHLLGENQKLNQNLEKSAQEIERSAQEIERLNRMIEKSIQVDVEIEEKRRQRVK